MKTLLLIIPLALCFIAKSNAFQWADTTVVELITFESESAYFVQSTPTTNCWQIGQPSKILFNEAYSVPNSIVTDTLNPYPANNHSWFDLVVDLNNWMPNLGIGFYQKLQTESNTDGGYITVSYDKGATWNNIIQDTVCHFLSSPSRPYFENVNLYSVDDKLFNGEPGFSGTISDWQYVEFYWVMNMVTKSPDEVDTLLIRFNFISDAIPNEMDGWMIDDIRLFYNHDFGGIAGNEANKNLLVFPNPVSENAIIRTKNQQTITGIKLFSINGQLLSDEANLGNEYLLKKGNLKPGVYFVTCLFNSGTLETIRLIVQ
jgi:hypothetical protein